MSDPDEIEILEASGSERPSASAPAPSCESAPSKNKLWTYYKLKEDDGKKFAVCNLCPKKSFTYSGGTSTLWKHLKNIHFILRPKLSETQPQLQPTSSVQNPVAKQVSIEDAFARYKLFSHCLSL